MSFEWGHGDGLKWEEIMVSENVYKAVPYWGQPFLWSPERGQSRVFRLESRVFTLQLRVCTLESRVTFEQSRVKYLESRIGKAN